MSVAGVCDQTPTAFPHIPSNLKASTAWNLTATSGFRSEPLFRAKANYFDSSTNENLSVTVVGLKNRFQNHLDQATGFVSSLQGFCKVIFNTLRGNMKQQPDKWSRGSHNLFWTFLFFQILVFFYILLLLRAILQSTMKQPQLQFLLFIWVEAVARCIRLLLSSFSNAAKLIYPW